MPHIINGVECRNREESLRHIIKQAKAEKIGPKVGKDSTGSCQYHYPSGNNCAVGSLFSDNQIAYIKRFGMNDTRITLVATNVGADNIKTVTGMAITELQCIQSIHDQAVSSGAEKARQKVIAYCEKELEKAQAKV